VDLFIRKPLAAKIGTHHFGGVPTNHFNDFRHLIYSPVCIRALEEVLQNATPENIAKEVQEILRQISMGYGKNEREKKEALFKFAEHIGIINEKNKTKFDEMDSEIIKRIIEHQLNRSLKERADSMALLRYLLIFNRVVNGSVKPSISEVVSMLEEFQRTLKEKYLLNSHSKAVGEVLPSFEPSHKILFQQMIDVLMKNGKTGELVQFCEMLRDGKAKVEDVFLVAHSQGFRTDPRLNK